MKYVYELRRKNTTIYVGESKNPKLRYNQHVRWKPSPGNGMFYKQFDLELVIVAGPLSIRKARDLEYSLKESYGMEVGERIGKKPTPKKAKVKKYKKYLTQKDIEEIKSKYVRVKYGIDKLSREYGVSSKTIHRCLTIY